MSEIQTDPALEARMGFDDRVQCADIYIHPETYDHVITLDPPLPARPGCLIVECDRLVNHGPALTGPGIETATWLNLPETAAFRANQGLFPLGFDTVFTAGDRLSGLPRTTRVEKI